MGELVNTLAVRVITSDISDAGTDNDVYFDIGPLGWKLSSSGNDFERGSDTTYEFPEAKGLQLDTDDIIWLRLQKKGIGGVAGTPGGPFSGWHPQEVRLLVNGREFVKVAVDRWLDDDNPLWVHVLREAPEQEMFARTLRVIANNALGQFDEDIAFLTTPFKIIGISGWLGLPLPITCASGTVIRPPAQSTDGLATIDIRLSTVQLGDHLYILDGRSGVRLPRFLRVEYQFRKFFPVASGEQAIPNAGDFVRICGEVKVDTDQEGWYEIHPRGPSDVIIGAPPSSLRSSLATMGFDPTQGVRRHVALTSAFSLRSFMGLS